MLQLLILGAFRFALVHVSVHLSVHLKIVQFCDKDGKGGAFLSYGHTFRFCLLCIFEFNKYTCYLLVTSILLILYYDPIHDH